MKARGESGSSSDRLEHPVEDRGVEGSIPSFHSEPQPTRLGFAFWSITFQTETLPQRGSSSLPADIVDVGPSDAVLTR
jgi:hypothetical protein